MDQNPRKSTDWLDRAAVMLSALCLVHCLALPLLVVGLPFLSQFSEGHLHAQVLVIVVPLSTAALVIGYRRHHDLRIISGGVLGMLLLVIGATVAHQRLGLTADRLFTIVGSLVLGTSHFFNSYRRKLSKSSY
jgi:MFS superfamily sulfate permease-like transporter